MNEPAFSGFPNYQHKQKHEPPPRGPGVIPGKSTKWCPQCAENGKKTARRRRYTLSGPLKRSDCDPAAKVHQARISSREVWWNKGLVHWLIAPPYPSTDYPWFEVRAYARCPIHGWLLIDFYIRQFGRIRLPVIWLEAHVTHSVNWIIPVDAHGLVKKK